MDDITSLCKRVILISEGFIIYDGLLSKLTKDLTPYRLVDIEFNEVINKSSLEKFGKVLSHTTYKSRLLIQRENTPQSVSYILNEYNIKDLDISDPPIEDLIGNLLAKGNF